MLKIRPEDILKQAHDTYDLIFPDQPEEELDLGMLWEFAFSTYQVCGEGEIVPFSLADLEAAFEQPRGCPTSS